MARKTRETTTELSALAAALPPLIAAADARRKAITARMAKLERAGLIYATEHWRRDGKSGKPAYLYLLHPSHAGEARKREYVGLDAKKIKLARDGIQRAKEFDELTSQHQHLQLQLSEAFDTLQRAYRLLNQQW